MLWMFHQWFSAACVLHNFCLTIHDFFDNDDDEQIPFPVPRPQEVAKRNQMVIFLDH